MAPPAGGWREQPWLSLLVLPVLVLLFGSSLRIERPVDLGGVWRVAASEPERRAAVALSRRAEGEAPEPQMVLAGGERLELEMTEPAEILGVEVQADHQAQLRVMASRDRAHWSEIATVAAVEPRGLRSRSSRKSPENPNDPGIKQDEGSPDAALVRWLRLESVAGQPVAIADVRPMGPRLAIPPWLLAPTGVWSAWLLLISVGDRSRRTLRAWRRWDLPIAAVGFGLVVPFLTLPMLASGALTALLRWRLDGARAEAERLWSAGAFLAIAVVATAHFALVTQATGDLAGSELLGVAYDSLADHLQQGSSGVDRYAIRWEVFDVDGRPTMYFGPLPALLRIPAHWIAPTGYGNWSRLSCWTAALLSLAAALLILRAPLRGNPWLSPRARRSVLALSAVAFGLGTPIAFAMSAAAIYHEAPLWGLAGSLFGVHFALELARSRKTPGAALTGLSIAAGAALLSRATFGAPLYLLIGGFGLLVLHDARRAGERAIPRTVARLLLWTSPALAMLAFQGWLNFDRFGGIATFIDFQYLAYLAEDQRSWEILQRTGTFDLDRVPTALANYFGIRPEALMTHFPFVAMIRPAHLAPDLYPTIFRETVASLSVVSSWLVAGALVGVLGVRRATIGWPIRGVLIALFTQPLLVLSYYLVSQRYALDFLPFLWAAYACCVGGLGRHVGGAAAQAVLATAVAASLFATSCATLSWIPQSRRFTPQEYKDQLHSAVRDLSALLHDGPGT